MANDEELHQALKKINECDLYVVRDELIKDIYVQKAVDKMNAFIRKYPVKER